MRLLMFLVISLCLHGLTLFAPVVHTEAVPSPVTFLTVELAPEELPPEPEPPPKPLEERMSTEPDEIPPPPAPPPKTERANKLATRQAQSRLMERLLYPPAAVAQGLEGEVIVLLTLDSHGRVTAASVARSSGHALLDQAALDAARSIDSVRSNSGELLLPVEFALN